MATWNLGSVAARAYLQIPDVDTTTSGNLIHFADNAMKTIANYTGTAIGSNAIGTTYQTIAVDFTAAYAYSRMMSVGIDANIALGDFKVEKSSSSRPEAQQIQTWLNQAVFGLKLIGRSMPVAKAFG